MRFVELSTKLLNATFNIMINAATTSNIAVAGCMRRAMLTVACIMTYSIDSTKFELKAQNKKLAVDRNMHMSQP